MSSPPRTNSSLRLDSRGQGSRRPHRSSGRALRSTRISDPARRMRSRRDEPETTLYTSSEKILAADETLPADWPTAGHHGLRVPQSRERPVRRYHEGGRVLAAVRGMDRRRNDVRGTDLSEEDLNPANRPCRRNADADPSTRPPELRGIATRATLPATACAVGLREIIACFPVYRSYISGEVTEADRRHVLRAVRRATLRNPALSSSIFHLHPRYAAVAAPRFRRGRRRATPRSNAALSVNSSR